MCVLSSQIARGSKARIQHIETDTKLKTANKELRKAKSTLDNITKQSHKAKPRRGSKTDVQCSKTENVSIEDQAQYFKVRIKIFFFFKFTYTFLIVN